jgi:prepilin-type N-terminal cleavage/methylation domain-containing protein
VSVRDGRSRARRRRHRRTAGFTLIEMLVVISIILVLAGALVGVSRALSDKANRDRTLTLIDRIETALTEYRLEFGHWPNSPNSIPSAAGPPTPGQLLNANGTVAAWLVPYGQFDLTVGMGRAGEIVQVAPGQYYVVDIWYDPEEPAHDLDPTGAAPDNGYQFINIATNGFNAPELDIWSNGPDGVNNRNPSDCTVYGDDIVNWGRR